jgi:ABC-type dipeptide/oligopeptide/nickel transport system permease subunit
MFHNKEEKLTSWAQLRQAWGWRLGIFILLGFTLIALLAPVITPYDYREQNVAEGLMPPLTGYDIITRRLEACHLTHTPVEWLCSLYLLGSDALGRDYYSRLVYGSRVYVLITVFAVSVSFTVGTVYGLIMAYFQIQKQLAWRLLGVPFQVVQEGLAALPGFFLAILLYIYLVPFIRLMHNEQLAQVDSAVVRQFIVWNEAAYGLPFLCLVIGLTCWLHTAKTVRRYLVLAWQKQADKEPTWHNLVARLRHIAPDLFKVLVMTEMLVVPTYFLTELFLAYAHIGVLPPYPTWSVMLAEAYSSIRSNLWLTVWPTLTLTLLFMAFYAIGFSLRDQLKLAHWIDELAGEVPLAVEPNHNATDSEIYEFSN